LIIQYVTTVAVAMSRGYLAHGRTLPQRFVAYFHVTQLLWNGLE
jgi:hypothetical protein